MRRALELLPIRPAALAFSTLAVGCSDESVARRQLLVSVDTDVPAPSQVGASTELSADSSVDTLRVDVLWDETSVGLSQLFVVPEADSWPVSFGIADARATSVGLRLRVFRGALARAGEVAGAATLDPEPGATVDRFVRLRIPPEGVREVSVVLEGDCWGRPAVFGSQATTCVGGVDVAVNDDGDVTAGHATKSVAGTWAQAHDKPCGPSATQDTACVAGRFALLGERSLAAVGAPGDLLDSAPLRPVVMSSFRMDRTEYSVGRLRQLVKQGKYSGELPKVPSPGLDADCTWLGVGDSSADDLPVTCVSFVAARAICKASGGDLPSEAQWEFAARGRGSGRHYPWGDTPPKCCTGVFSRPVAGELGDVCTGPTLEAVDRARACDGDTDVSPEGIFDLAGNVREQVLDAPLPFTHPCWRGPGVLFDPECEDASELRGSVRGGSGYTGIARALAALRQVTGQVGGFRGEGFRCVYPAG